MNVLLPTKCDLGYLIHTSHIQRYSHVVVLTFVAEEGQQGAGNHLKGVGST